MKELLLSKGYMSLASGVQTLTEQYERLWLCSYRSLGIGYGSRQSSNGVKDLLADKGYILIHILGSDIV